MVARIFGLFKSVFVFILLLSSVQLNAAIQLTADKTLVCGGNPVVLKNDANSEHYLKYEFRYTESDVWRPAGASEVRGTVFTANMVADKDQVYYRVTDTQTGEVSNVVTITRDLSDQCSKTCHQTETGDIIMGTGFTPKDPSNTNPRIPNDVESYFHENDIKFRESDEKGYKIRNDLDVFFGVKPKQDQGLPEGVSNYYFTVENVNKPVCQLVFDPKKVCLGDHIRHYQYVMRVYLQFDKDCSIDIGRQVREAIAKGDSISSFLGKPDIWGNSSFMARTGFGMETKDHFVGTAYNDRTGEMITPGGETVGKNRPAGGSDVARVYMKDLVDYNKVGYDENGNIDLIRLELTYFGEFPLTSTQQEFVFTPFFEQLDHCTKVAVDYISAEVEAICSTAGTVCVGNTTVINATGFPYKATYEWEYLVDEVNDVWDRLLDAHGQSIKGPDYKRVELLVDKVGVMKCRVRETTNNEIDLRFEVVGEKCDPESPSRIDGDAQICAPNENAIEYTPYPVDYSNEYVYTWLLTKPDGDVVTDESVIFFNDPLVTGKVSVKIPADYPQGNYSLTVQLNSKGGNNTLNPIGDPFTAVIPVWHRPSAEFLVDGSKDSVCPYKADVKFEAIQKSEDYTYDWTNATATTNPAFADVTMPSNYCALNSIEAKLKVYVTTFEACSDEVTKNFTIDKTQPEVNCEGLGGNKDLYISATTSDTTYVLPKPEILKTCDADPTVVIELKGVLASGEPYNKQITSKLSALDDDALTVTIPVTAGKVDGEKGQNGIRVTYVAKDGCNIESDTCEFFIYVRDTFPPVVECEKIPYYVVNDSLSLYPYEQCVATPGTSGHLPFLTAPSLEDLLHPGNFITGTYEGRIHNGVEENKALNDPYEVGTTLIRWKFYDDARNSDSCFQTIIVVDDKKPEVSCPNVTDFKVHPDMNACTVSADSLIAQINSQLGTDIPVATDRCEAGVQLTPSYFYRVVGTTEWLPLESASKFELKVNYELQWRFYKNEGVGVDNKVYASCEKPFSVIDDKEPNFDCNSLDDVKIVVAPSGECQASKEHVMDSFNPWPTATEACTGDPIPGVLTLEDGSPLPDYFKVGDTVRVKWTFADPSKTTGVKVCYKAIKAISDKEIDGNCGKVNYPDIQVDVTDDKCAAQPADVLSKLVDHFAKHPCLDYNIKAVPSRSDGLPMNAPYPVDTISIIWTFTDTTYSLVNPQSTCDQVVMISNKVLPSVVCSEVFPDNKIYLDTLNCAADFTDITVNLVPPVNPCNGEVAKVDSVRQSGKGMHDPYEVGTDVIVWTLTYPSTGMTSQCSQNIEVLDTFPPNFDCSSIPAVIQVEHRDSLIREVAFSVVQNAGFVIPTAYDRCCTVTTTASRSDGRQIEDNYPMGKTVITFRFTDNHGNYKECKQIVEVLDMIPPTIRCPKVSNGNLACLLSIPDAFETYAEFVAAGGAVEPIEKVVISSFRHEDVTVGDSCVSTTIRTYLFTAINGESVSCYNPDTFVAIDNVAPVILGVGFNDEYTTTCDVTDTVPPMTVVAEDNCDPNLILSVVRVSTQGSDPSQCDFYSYDVVYTWNAVDRCGNVAQPRSYTAHVRNTVPPEVHLPENWGDPIYPDYLKNCLFGVPSITDLIPLDSIYQKCGFNQYLQFWQVPAAGTIVNESQTIYLHISDVCGNETVLTKNLVVQKRKEILNVIVNNMAEVCADESAVLNPRSPRVLNSLSSSSIRTNTGVIYAKDNDGIFWPVPTTVVWDCYRGNMNIENLKYSNNRFTYAHMFADAAKNDEAGNAAFSRYNLLLRRSQSDYYYYVATDTISGCRDTAVAYIDVREVPRVSIESTVFNICEGDSLDLFGEFGSQNPVCVEAMGAPVTSEGWVLNGTPYEAHTPVTIDNGDTQVAYYQATNVCGTTTSLNSLYTSCSGAPVNVYDSIYEAGSIENYYLWLEDKLRTSDSVVVNVFSHYDPAQVLLTANPHNPSKIWEGDNAELVLSLPYTPFYTIWKRVEGEFDGMGSPVYNQLGQKISISGEFDDAFLNVDYGQMVKNTITDTLANGKIKNRYTLIAPADSALYYVLVGNGVCPTVQSNVVSVDVNHKLPTAITPYTLDGLNDVFMKGHKLVIFNRYGGMVYQGEDGWDGTSKGLMADPGVYFYEVYMNDGSVRKGSVEVVKIE